jgi:hypothetical protein
MITMLSDGQLQTIDLLVQEAISFFNDRRGEQRYPFFRPVIVESLESKEPLLKAFCTDISSTGMGLLSHSKLPAVKATFTLMGPQETAIDLVGRIVWTASYGDGWFKSGVEFCGR